MARSQPTRFSSGDEGIGGCHVLPPGTVWSNAMFALDADNTSRTARSLELVNSLPADMCALCHRSRER